MAKSELVDAIRDAYLKANPDIKPGTLTSPVVDLEQFCAFAANWLTDNKIVGVGHSTGAVSLRFADGRELNLMPAAEPAQTADTPAVSLTRGGVSARHGIGVADTSFGITGK